MTTGETPLVWSGRPELRRTAQRLRAQLDGRPSRGAVLRGDHSTERPAQQRERHHFRRRLWLVYLWSRAARRRLFLDFSLREHVLRQSTRPNQRGYVCLLYTSDAADE